MNPKVNKKTIKKLNRFGLGFLKNEMDFHMADNSIYNVCQVLKAIIFCSINNRYFENGLKRLSEKSRDLVPNADTVHYWIKKKNRKEILEEFIKIQDNLLLKLRKARLLWRRVIVFIDETEIPWFGNKNLPWVVRTTKFKGTSFCFKYMTVNALIGDLRICLCVIPVTPFSINYKLVDELLKVAKKRVKISKVLFDRGFSNDSKVLKVVEEHGLKYLAPMQKNNAIKRLIEESDEMQKFCHFGYEHGKERIETNLFFIFNPEKEDEKEIWERYSSFCTNLPLNDSSRQVLADFYRKRWNIENFYRDGKGNFLIKTKTNSFIVRLFFFWITTILYNLWYFIRLFKAIIAERWKDLLTEMFYLKSRLGYSEKYGEMFYERMVERLS